MARWYATGVDGTPYGAVVEAPTKRQAIDWATARDGERCFGVVSVLAWEDHLAEQRIRRRTREEAE